MGFRVDKRCGRGATGHCVAGVLAALCVTLCVAGAGCSYNRWTGALPEHQRGLCKDARTAPGIDTVLAVLAGGLSPYFIYEATQPHCASSGFFALGVCSSSNASNVLYGITGGLTVIGALAYGFSAAYGFRRAKTCAATTVGAQPAPAIVPRVPVREELAQPPRP